MKGGLRELCEGLLSLCLKKLFRLGASPSLTLYPWGQGHIENLTNEVLFPII
jgi:hypothetical protein